MSATLQKVLRASSEKKSILNLCQNTSKIHASSQRMLSLQEYQSKKLMADYDINVQKFHVVENAEEGLTAANSLMENDAKELVIKAMVLAGGRGKGHFTNGFKGGVHLTKDPKDVPSLCEGMIGSNIITKQTPPGGVPVSKVMVAQALDITRETYFAILMDRAFNGPVMVGSPAGGMDIEEVAEKTPDLIFKEAIDINAGISESQAMGMASNLGFTGDKQKVAAEQITNLYKLFLDVDATQVEINPFGETDDGEVVCFDAKVNFDDNAEFRQKEIHAMHDTTEMDPLEVDAESHNLNYISMDGDIACLVNGAGLAMATMDIIHHCGGSPANFLDLGGGVQEHQVFHAFRIFLEDKKVKSIWVNIFGGIVDCRVIANGIVKAAKELNITMPMVVRLEGFNMQEARQTIQDSGLPIISVEGFAQAAQKVVDITKEL